MLHCHYSKLLTLKSKDPSSFTILVTIDNLPVKKVLLNLKIDINLMLLFTMKKIGILKAHLIRMAL